VAGANGAVDSINGTENPGNGGNGTSDTITGTTRAGGGGASGYTIGYGSGGAGGGGRGANTSFPTPVNGTANTGGGGGGGGGYLPLNGANGGSGIVLIRYPSSYGAGKCTGGTQTLSGGYYIHTFTGSGTFTVN
jgi:hypothetical protein